jgi:hypothetical protein
MVELQQSLDGNCVTEIIPDGFQNAIERIGVKADEGLGNTLAG